MYIPKIYRHLFIGLAITLLIAAIELFSTGALGKLLNRVEGIIYDSRLLLTLPNTPRKLDETVIIIDIDEKTMLETRVASRGAVQKWLNL
ncbi:hypothetical protein ACOBV9_02115 [Pseudoalteromonas espejiana]